MNILNVHTNIINDYAEYTKSFIAIADEQIRNAVDRELADKRYWPEPLLQFNPAYQKAGKVEDLVRAGKLNPSIATIFRGYELYQHQLDAIQLGLQNTDFVVTSGTGSGKSLTYIGTIFNHILNNPTLQGVVAIVVYPMNALINSQTEEFNKYKFNYESQTNTPFPIQFGQYTGQEDEEKRNEMRQNPPHILLTNYMMLELMMTRQIDSALRQAIFPNLKYLVFDEMHTYRGRQGADVAMLIRRIRANVAHAVTCIGTSATMVSGGTEQSQKITVASVASTLFGKSFDATQVINESLQRSLNRPHYTIDELRAAVRRPVDSNASAEELANHPLANWLENDVALELKDGVFARRKPMKIQDVAERLSVFGDISKEYAYTVLNQMLMWISNVNAHLYNDGRRYTYLPYRIHQFFAQTGSVYISLEQPDKRYVTLEAARYRPDSDDKVPLYPTFFSRTTGEAFVGVYLNAHSIEPRDLREPKLMGDDDGSAISDPNGGYLILNTDVWDPERDLESLPETWFNIKNKMRPLLPKYQKRVPRRIWFDRLGRYSDTPSAQLPYSGWFMSAPLLFDPSSGQIYDSTAIRENSKLSELGGGGRSTATTITTLSILTQLKESGFSLRDQKLLSFTDNRQDAALQAGHFNDFVQVIKLRAALYHAIKTNQQQELTISDLGIRVREALNLPDDAYTSGNLIDIALRQKKQQLEKFITYRLLEDAVRSWKVVLPNLEQCALISYGYQYFDEAVNHPTHWNDLLPVAALPPHEREAFLLTILDFFRFEYALTDSFWFSNLDTTEQSLHSGLLDPWILTRDEKLQRPAVIRLESVNQVSRDMTTKSAGYQSALGKYIRQYLQQQNPLFRVDAAQYTEFMYQLFDKLVSAGYLSQFQLHQGSKVVHGYALNATMVIWKLGNENSVRADAVRQRSYRTRVLSPNRYFQQLYKTPFASHKQYLAKDHTGQLTNDDRQEREERFRADWYKDGQPDNQKIAARSISALYCSPTMELGVDIGGLTVVHMRNAPPNPANYAQRSGRAGRSGQGALVFTYCSYSPHDQHYFKHQTDLVAGAVSPPQIDLLNEDLLRTHLHAVAFGAVGMPSQSNSLADYVDLNQANRPLKPEIIAHLRFPPTQAQHIYATFKRAINDIDGQLHSDIVTWYNTDWISTSITAMASRLETTFMRWRTMYEQAKIQLVDASQAIQVGGLNPISKEYRELTRKQNEATAQIALLENQRSRNNSLSEFYPYRYFAAEGYLPGYNFTRLPVRVFIPTFGDYQGEFISRGRTIALSEFGPDNVIYHNGNKYRVKQLVTMSEIDKHLVQAKASLASGYLMLGNEMSIDVCPITQQPLYANGDTKKFLTLLEMNECRAKPVERITCDEEYRLREGYKIETYFSLPGGLHRVQNATIRSADQDLIHLRYFPAASIHHINTKWAAEPDSAMGFPIHNTSGFWTRRSKIDDTTNAPGTYLTVTPWTSVTADALYIEPLRALGLKREQIITLQYALKRGIELAFQVEPSEIGVTLVGNNDNPNMFIYESAEGSLGIMARFMQQPHTFNTIVINAINICRYDDTSYKAPASYDDLLSYYNQTDHAVINRFDIRDTLTKLATCTVEVTGHSQISYTEQYQLLLRTYDQSSKLELRFLEYLYANSLRLPDAAQKAVADAYIRPDFYYADRIWIFCDGTPHDDPRVYERDSQVREYLRDQGDQVVVWNYRLSIEEFIAARPDIFYKVR